MESHTDFTKYYEQLEKGQKVDQLRSTLTTFEQRQRPFEDKTLVGLHRPLNTISKIIEGLNSYLEITVVELAEIVHFQKY